MSQLAGITSKYTPLRTKLLGIVCFWVLVFLAAGSMVWSGMYRSNGHLDAISQLTIPQITLVDDIELNLSVARRFEKEFFLFSSAGKNERIAEKQMDYHKKMLDRFDLLRSLIQDFRNQPRAQGSVHPPEVLTRVDEIESLFDQTLTALHLLCKPLVEGSHYDDQSPLYVAYKTNVRKLEDAVKNLRKSVLGNLEAKNAEIAEFKAAYVRMLLITGGLAIVLGIAVTLKGVSAISTAAGRVMDGIRAAGTGKFQPIEVDSRDEFSEIARVFNETVPKIMTDEQRREMERNLIQLLDIVSNAADGDLRGKAPVTADVFGSVADAYNLMVEGLAELISGTSRQAQEVGCQTQQMLDLFQRMEEGVDAQGAQVGKANAALSETAGITRAIAEKATLAQQVSSRVDEVTALGHQRVNRNIEGMQQIRVAVQTINKKMKALSERLMEIGTISELISEISTRTTILAMNASIEASRAGDQGRGFVVISDEIKKLADKSTAATRQIGGILKAIQNEAVAMTATLEEETRSVENQTRLVKETGEAFGVIEQAIGDSRSVVAEIHGLSTVQARCTEDTVRSMAEVSTLSVRTRALVSDSARIAEGLNALSEELLSAIANFRLPEEESIDLVVRRPQPQALPLAS